MGLLKTFFIVLAAKFRGRDSEFRKEMLNYDSDLLVHHFIETLILLEKYEQHQKIWYSDEEEELENEDEKTKNMHKIYDEMKAINKDLDASLFKLNKKEWRTGHRNEQWGENLG